MGQASVQNLSEVQRERLARFGTTECADVHCHPLGGLDDGPATMEQSLALCRALVADGITTIVATPHQLGRYEGRNSAPAVRQAVNALQAELTRQRIPLKVVVGADVRLNERIPALLESDTVLTLADGHQFLLLELPHEVYVDPRPLLSVLVARGIRPVMSHPERHGYLRTRLPLVSGWLEQGAILQITAGSLVGDFGPAAEAAAWDLVQRGWVSLVATDAHDVNTRPPRLSAAIDAIARRLCHTVARRLCIENPLRILQGEDILPPADRRRMEVVR